MASIDREEFQSWMELLRADIGGVNARLDVLNGRTRQVEGKVAVLEDRGVKDPTARASGAAALLTTAITVAWQWLTKP